MELAFLFMTCRWCCKSWKHLGSNFAAQQTNTSSLLTIRIFHWKNILKFMYMIGKAGHCILCAF